MIFLLLILIFTIPFFVYFRRYLKSQEIWSKSEISREKFIEENKDLLSKTTLGCSFAPEEWSYEEIQDGAPMAALEFIVKKLEIKNIRLGLRWNNLVDEKNRIRDLGYFKKYLDFCIKNNVNICLNIGPIKSFRWPEEHIPKHILEKASYKLATISTDSEIAKLSYQFVHDLFGYIKANYSEEDLDKIKIIQPENEGFNRMGVLKLKASEEYMTNVIKIIHDYFPNKKILINSAGRFNLRQIVRVFKKLLSKDSSFKDKLIIGYDYYYKTEFRDKFFLSRILDSTDFSLPWDMRLSTLKKLATKYDFEIEVTEAQFEKWGKQDGPGEKLMDLQFVILKIRKSIPLPENQKKLIVRLWGIEKLAKKYLRNELSKEEKEIIKFVS